VKDIRKKKKKENCDQKHLQSEENHVQLNESDSPDHKPAQSNKTVISMA